MIRMSRNSAGFSLIELCILTVIVGLIAATSLQTYRLWSKRVAGSVTSERKSTVEIALGRYLSVYGRLPCPADSAVDLSLSGAGKEVPPASHPIAFPTRGCTAGQGWCRVDGAWRVVGNGGASPARDTILRGSVPTNTLGISNIEGVDGWGNKFEYAVSENLCNTALAVPYNENNGVIAYNQWDKVTSTDAPVANPRVLDPGGNPKTGSFPMALVSYGPDGNGAFTYYGQNVSPCDLTKRQGLNCSRNQGTFLATNYKVLNPQSPGFYDDAAVTMQFVRSYDIWTLGATPGSMNNTGGKLVGVGFSDSKFPTQSLDVNGNFKADKVKANWFCDKDGANCMNPSLVGGVGYICGVDLDRHSLAGGVQSNKLTCINMVNGTGIAPGNCPPPGKAGWCADGTFVCVPPAGKLKTKTTPCGSNGGFKAAPPPSPSPPIVWP